MDGDSVTITTVSELATTGALLATRPFQTGEVTATNESVTVDLTTTSGLLIGLVDATDNTIAQTYVAGGGETLVSISASGNDLTTCKLAIWYIDPLPYEVTVLGVFGIDPEPPSDPYWVVNTENVGDSTVNANIIGITTLTSSGIVDGAVLATHTETFEDTTGANAVEFDIYYSGENSIVGATFNVVDPTDSTILATFTPTSDMPDSVHVERGIEGGIPTTIEIQLVTNENTVANLPLYYSVSNVVATTV